MPIAVANRYARALADIVARTANYRAVQAELEGFRVHYRQSAELREVFETPAVPPPVKMKVLEAILARLGVSQVSSNFLHVLVARYRMGLLDEILAAFVRIGNERLGIVQVKIVSAAPLSEVDQEALRIRFEQITRRQVELEFHENKELLGGVLAQIRSTVYDGSVRGRLDRIRQNLISQ
jgi:F-type H+-transporting ATPase subunit delta